MPHAYTFFGRGATMFPTMMLAFFCAGADVPQKQAEQTQPPSPNQETVAALAAPAAPSLAANSELCQAHDGMLTFAREAAKLLTSRDQPYFIVKQRLLRVNEHYMDMHERLERLSPPHNDHAAEMLWRLDALGELLQVSGENLEHLAHEMKTADRVCNQDLAAYEEEFGPACAEDAKPGCAEKVFVRYCSKARQRNKIFKVGETTNTGTLKWPRFFDTHWAGPTKVGEASEGWREDWTYGDDDEVWHNLGVEISQDERRLEVLAQTEMAYSAYTMIDTKPLLTRMVYNVVHGTMHGGVEQPLGEAIETVYGRIRRIMRCGDLAPVAPAPSAQAAGAPQEAADTPAATPDTPQEQQQQPSTGE